MRMRMMTSIVDWKAPPHFVDIIPRISIAGLYAIIN
jgi:hypothetical protein